MEQAILQLLRVVTQLEQCSVEVRSLFQLTIEADFDYRWGWVVLRQAEQRGLVTVQRSGPGVPLGIASTDDGKALVSVHDPKWETAPL